uniref:Uncharacterized protein n=1 Tax=Rhizophora mucronata TaxID=61149 RepID=A0A2P2PDY9_RHIMU
MSIVTFQSIILQLMYSRQVVKVKPTK